MEIQKKANILLILNVLKEYTDENHKLTQNQIAEKVLELYGLELERKTVGSSLQILEDLGYDINKGDVNGGFYLLDRAYGKSEAQYMVDAIYSSKSISTQQADSLVNAITSELSKYERKEFVRINKTTDESRNINADFFYNIELINEAISRGKKISFKYIQYDNEGMEEFRYNGMRYYISPYYLINNFGKYYCLSVTDKFDGITHFRLDYMRELRIENDNDARDRTRIDEIGFNFRIENYIKDHIYMFGGKTITARLLVESKQGVTNIIDWFGKCARITKDGDFSIASVKCNENALFYWLLQYSSDITVLEPEELKTRITIELNKSYKKYRELVNMDMYEPDLAQILRQGINMVSRNKDADSFREEDYRDSILKFVNNNVLDQIDSKVDEDGLIELSDTHKNERYLIRIDYHMNPSSNEEYEKILTSLYDLDMKDGAKKKFYCLICKGSTYSKGNIEGPYDEYFKAGKKITLGEEIELSNDIVAYSKLIEFRWSTMQKGSMQNWHKFLIIEL